MAQHNHSSHPPDVPAALVAERRAVWNDFTLFIKANIVALIALLVFLLLVAKVF